MMANIYIRVDGSSDIGLGHLYRCLALFKMIENVYKITFVISPASIIAIPILKEYQVHEFVVDENESYINRLVEEDIVVLDGYHFDTAYQFMIKKMGSKVIVIDDLHDKHFYADAIINTALGLSPHIYNAEPYTSFYLGPDYVLLRAPFLERAKRHKSTNQHGIVISIGGSDPLNITQNIVSVLSNRLSDEINIVLGAGYEHEQSLRSITDNITKAEIHRNLSADELVVLFSSNRAIITSASVSAYEALCCNNNVIVGYYTNNQIDMYNGLVDAKEVTGIGYFSKENIMELRNIISSHTFSVASSRNLIDGKSPERIYKIVETLASDR